MNLSGAKVKGVRTDNGMLTVCFADGRRLSAPLAWYPSLAEASPPERSAWDLGGIGEGIHGPDLDHDLSIEGLFAGAKELPGLVEYTRWIRTLSRPRRRKATYGDWLAIRGKRKRAMQPA
jgi:hypothetical protein